MPILDIYNPRARLLPAVIGIATAIVIATISVSWTEMSLPQAIVTAAVAVFFVAASDLARRTSAYAICQTGVKHAFVTLGLKAGLMPSTEIRSMRLQKR